MARFGRVDTDRYEDDVQQALLEADLNENEASGAPQQAVVNGWVARDLLAIQIEQNNDLANQQMAIIAVLVLGIGVVVVRTHRPSA